MHWIAWVIIALAICFSLWNYIFRVRKDRHFIWQKSAMDCGPTCLQMVASWHGTTYQTHRLREMVYLGRDGVSLANLENCARKLGFITHALALSPHHLKKIPLPAILHWNSDHFVVLSKVDDRFHIQDPALGQVSLSIDEFSTLWTGKGDTNNQGAALILQVSENGLQKSDPVNKINALKALLISFLNRRWKFLYRLFALVITGSLLLLIQPWLWSIMLDAAVDKRNASLLMTIISSQLVLGVLGLWLSFYQGKTFLVISNSLAKFLLNGFMKKLMQLPMHVFERRPLGDLSQRLEDVERIQGLLKAQPLITLVSTLSSVIFLAFLFHYQISFALIFILITALAFCWAFYFYQQRRILDYQYFSAQVHYQDQVLDILNGASEIKALNFGDHKLRRWRYLYAKSYGFKRELEYVGLKQRVGYRLLHLIKDAIIFYLAGTAIINGSLTTGTLLSVSYILQRLNQPLEDILALLDDIQDCHLSAERFSDLLEEQNEPDVDEKPVAGDLFFKDVSFAYPGKEQILFNLNFNLPEGSVTAVVGTSGSGKSTLMKLILGFYPVTSGDILLANKSIKNHVFPIISSQSSVVQQEGYLFSDTIKGNIILDKPWDQEWFNKVLSLTCLDEWVEDLEQQELTMLGHGGNPVSGGQKQRILLARALYRKPRLLFLDEASSALDARTEREISENLIAYCREYNCTTLIIAHRLSTIKNAQQILVLEKGSLVEKGTHEKLLRQQGAYSLLLQHQL